MSTDKEIYKENKEIYIEANKKNGQEAILPTSSLKNKFWNETRNLSFPRYSNNDFQSIIENPTFYNSDSDRLIQEVWKEIAAYQELELGDKDEIIPVDYFNQVLFSVWADLKEQDSDFDLTEEQAKNIFGFDVVDLENEFGYQIDSSSLRNINVPSASSDRIEDTSVSRMDERIARDKFMECLQEIANDSLKNLTNIEYAIWLLIDYVEARKDNNQPRPDELTSMQFSDLLKSTSDDAQVEIGELEYLCKELRKKKNSSIIRIRANAIDINKIIRYNADHNENSQVEELWKQKIAAHD